jgi:hypothetical protein
VLLPGSGVISIQTSLLTGLDVGGAGVASVGNQHIRLLAGIGHDPLEHGLEMGSITGLVADPHRHDDLVVTIDRRLAVVALDPAIAALEDVAVWICAG